MNKVVITGASGFIGGELAKKLLTQGVTVYGIGLDSMEVLKTFGDFRGVTATFDEYDKLPSQIAERGFDAFFHLAWQGTYAKAYTDAALQSVNLAAAAKAAKVAAGLQCKRTVFGCSNYQYAVATDCSYPVNPNAYGIIKACAAEIFSAVSFENDMSCLRLVFPNTYGVNDKLNTAVVFFIKSMLEDKPLSLIGGEYRDDWIYIDDLIEGITIAAQSPKQYAEYYMGHRSITTFREKLITMKNVLRSESELSFGSYPESQYVDYDRIPLSTLYDDMGYEPRTGFEQSILKTADWIKRGCV